MKLFKLLIGDLQAQLEIREAEESQDTDEVSGLCVLSQCFFQVLTFEYFYQREYHCDFSHMQ